MAFFKFRWPGKQATEAGNARPARRSSAGAARPSQTQSIEDIRRRARHRLLGAVVLVAAGVVGFPLLFDSQPRPVPVNVAIDIPDRNKVAPLVVPQQDAAVPSAPPPTTPVASARAPVASSLGAGEELLGPAPARPAAKPVEAKPAEVKPVAAKPEPRPEPKVESRPVPKPEPKPEPRPEVKPAPKPEVKAESKPEPRPEAKPARGDDASRARALLEGRDPLPTAAAPARAEAPEGGRFIIQVGAFADADKAREVRDKLERAGLKTYTQAVETKDGRRTRVRVGPFSSRAEADKAAERVKGAGLAGAVLAL